MRDFKDAGKITILTWDKKECDQVISHVVFHIVSSL